MGVKLHPALGVNGYGVLEIRRPESAVVRCVLTMSSGSN